MKTIRIAVLSLGALLSVVAPVAAQEPVAGERHRPSLLMPLYAGNIALQALDLHSTKLALQAGNREGNPLFKDGSFGRMMGAKVAAGAITVVIVEKLWKKNRAASVGLMLAANVGLSAVVANNYRITKGNRPGS